MAALKPQLQALPEKAKEFGKKLGKNYLKGCGKATFEEIRAEMENEKEGVVFKLTQRDWYSVERSNLFTGTVYMQKGEGPGDFKNDWEQVYIVERQDYGIDIFKNEEAFGNKEKPKFTIQSAGYKLITKCNGFFSQRMFQVLGDLGLTEDMVAAHCRDLTSDCWALTHRFRTNYIFSCQEKVSEGCCSCCGGSKVVPVEEPGAETEPNAEREMFVLFFRSCVTKASPRPKTNLAKAFMITCKKLAESYGIENWTDDGTETEILVDLFMEICLADLRNAILTEMRGPMMLRIKLWYKVQLNVRRILVPVLTPIWDTIQSGVGPLRERIKPVIRVSLGPIISLKMSLEGRVNELLLGPLTDPMNTNIAPCTKVLLDSIANPMKDSLAIGRKILAERIKISSLPTQVKQRNDVLDMVPRDLRTEATICAPLNETLIAAAAELQARGEPYRRVFATLSFDEFVKLGDTVVLELLDAALFTLEGLLDCHSSRDETKTELPGDVEQSGGNSAEQEALQNAVLQLPGDVEQSGGNSAEQEALQNAVLQDYDHDGTIAVSKYVREVGSAVLADALKRVASPVINPIVSRIDSVIPEQFQDFLNIDQIVDNFIERMMKSHVEKVANETYPLPKEAAIS